MRTLFKIWLVATVVSLTFYTPIYFFSDNAVDAIEDITAAELIPYISIRGVDVERMENNLRGMGVDTDLSLDDALDDNPRVLDYRIGYAEGNEFKQLSLSTGLSFVVARAEVENGLAVELVFGVLNKHFLRNTTQVEGLYQMRVTDGQKILSIEAQNDLQNHIFGLFLKDEKQAGQSLMPLEQRFMAMRERELKAQPQPEPEATAAPAPVQAAASEPREIDSVTVAGNPSASQIVIFQFDGKPAYCADEGEDGANCRGDASSFIGMGTHKDYMDPDSALCIAGEPGCVLPQFFPADIKG